MNADNLCLDSMREKVLSAVFEVSNTLGAGFVEKGYPRALLRELSLRGTHGPMSQLSASFR